jgi:hypothetical protein
VAELTRFMKKFSFGEHIFLTLCLLFFLSFVAAPAFSETIDINTVPVKDLVIEVFSKISTSPGEIVTLPNSGYFDALIANIRNAQHSIDMTMFLFKATATPNNRPEIVLQELILARKRGVEVHVILDKSGYNKDVNEENEKVARKLRRNDIAVLLDSEKTTTHSKIVVIDGRFSFVGSHNLTHSALKYNNELSLLIDSRPLAQELLNYMRKIQ